MWQPFVRFKTVIIAMFIKKIGAGASILTDGASINIPRGTIVETRLAQELRIQQ